MVSIKLSVKMKEIKSNLTWNSCGNISFVHVIFKLNLIKRTFNNEKLDTPDKRKEVNDELCMTEWKITKRVLYHDTKHANSIITCHSSSPFTALLVLMSHVWLHRLLMKLSLQMRLETWKRIFNVNCSLKESWNLLMHTCVNPRSSFSYDVTEA